MDIKSAFSKEIKTIRIWIPKTNNNLIRNKYIKSFMGTVHFNDNLFLKGTLNPIWFGFLRFNP